MDVRRHISILWSSAWLIALAFIGGVGIGYVVSVQLPRTYEGRATLYVGQSLNDTNLGYNGILASQFLAQTYAQLATTRPLLANVIQDLDLNTTPERLANSVSAEVPAGGTILYVLARDTSADQAAAIANAVAKRVQALAPTGDAKAAAAAKDRLAELDKAIADTEKHIVDLLGSANRSSAQDTDLTNSEQRLTTLTSARNALVDTLPGLSPNTLTLVASAAPPDSAVSPPRSLIVGGTAAILVAMAVAFAYIRDAWRRAPPEATVSAEDEAPPRDLSARLATPEPATRSSR
jgi:capsular polysaccharide biosynthesis protein